MFEPVLFGTAAAHKPIRGSNVRIERESISDDIDLILNFSTAAGSPLDIRDLLEGYGAGLSIN